MRSYEVSIIIPCLNEEKYIKTCLESIYRQSFPLKDLEIIVVDGLSKDRTVEIVREEMGKGRAAIRLLTNPQRIQACAVNLGIREANGNYLVRLDAHSTYEADYVAKCVALAKKTGADNVGGIAIATASSGMGKLISLVLSSPFGVGNSLFRLGGKEGEAETVPFGTFPYRTFEKFGYFNELLARCEDKEFNQRIRRRGGRVYMSTDIKVFYHNRETIHGVAQQSFANGLWNVFTLVLSPGAVSLRNFVPLMFVASLLGLSGLLLAALLGVWGWVPLWAGLLALDLGLYFILNLGFSLKLARRNGYRNLPLLPLLFGTVHVSYGLGSLVGFGKLPAFLLKCKILDKIPAPGTTEYCPGSRRRA